MKPRGSSSRWVAVCGAAMALLGLALLGWVLSSITDLHARLAEISTPLAHSVLIALIVILGAILILGLRFMWVAAQSGRRTAAPAEVAADPTDAAAQSVAAARQQVELVSDEIARRALATELETVSSHLAGGRYTIVVFGTGSAGKTSIINALTGGAAGATDPVVGTTKESAEHTYTIEGFGDATLRLVDTPGLSEIGTEGRMREERARELAAGADLLLFVVDQDLRDIEYKPLESLARMGKRSVLVFNKRDLYAPPDLATIGERLLDRVGGIIEADDLVVCAADPAPITVRDATGDEATDKPAPDTTALAERLAVILRQDGRELLANNVLLRSARVSEKAREAIHVGRIAQARSTVTRFQWTTAAVMFVNPVPGLGALAAAAINYQMVMEIAKVFGTPITTEAAKRMAGELGQVMLKMGVVNIATNILGKALKASVVGYVAGGAIEAIAGAYLTKLSGEAFTDFFAHDQDWGEGGMQRAIEQRFQLEGRGEFVAAFIKEAAERVFSKTPPRS